MAIRGLQDLYRPGNGAFPANKRSEDHYTASFPCPSPLSRPNGQFTKQTDADVGVSVGGQPMLGVLAEQLAPDMCDWRLADDRFEVPGKMRLIKITKLIGKLRPIR